MMVLASDRRDPVRTAHQMSVRILAGILLALGICTIFCHGCHSGDHDDELILWLADRER